MICVFPDVIYKSAWRGLNYIKVRGNGVEWPSKAFAGYRKVPDAYRTIIWDFPWFYEISDLK